MKELDYDNVNWGEFFYYDPTSKSCLRWAVEKYSAYGKKKETWSGKEAGTLADVKNKENKAWSISFNIDGKYRKYKIHRIIAVMHGISVNGKVIDHINGISADNRIENMRATSILVNARNIKTPCNSPYGIAGVGFQQDSQGNSYFVARANVEGKANQKSFPIKRLGVMEAFKQAVNARQRYIELINQGGDEYTERHVKLHGKTNDFDEYKVSKEEYSKSFNNNKKRFDNSSGAIGVSFSKKSTGSTYATCYIMRNGKMTTRSFSVNKHGLLPSFAMAFNYRKELDLEQNKRNLT